VCGMRERAWLCCALSFAYWGVFDIIDGFLV